MDVVHHHLGVGLGSEVVTRGFHARADRLVVLDNPVVHDADLEPVAAREVRVRVRLGRRAVRRPARMGQAGHRLHPLLFRELRQVRDAPGRAQPLEVPVADERDAGRIVAAVFELADALDQEIDHVMPGSRADDAAHKFSKQ